MKKEKQNACAHGCVKSAIFGLKDRTHVYSCENFSDLLRKGWRYEGMNVESEHPFLRSHARLAELSGQSRIGRIEALRSCRGRLLLLTSGSGSLDFYVLRNGSFVKTFSTVEQYAPDYDFNGSYHDVVCTEDGSPHIVVGDDEPKLLFFPVFRYAVLDGNGEPYVTAEIPSEVPCFEHAAVFAGRLYGTIGQALYISGANGCFDWQYDSGGTVDPRKAFRCRITSSTERQTPVTALVGYHGNMLIFRENAVQKVVGSENPFAVKEMFQIGASNGRSVREVEGKLFFICGGKPYLLVGNSLHSLPELPLGMTATGNACAFGGKYYFSAEKSGVHYLLSCDARAEGYGLLRVSGAISDLISADDGLFALLDDGGTKKLSKMVNDRTNESFSFETEIFSGVPEPKSLTGAALYAKVGGGAALTLKAVMTNDAGQTSEKTLASGSGAGEKVLRFAGKLKKTAHLRLRVTGTGDVTLMRLAAKCRTSRSKNC